MSTTHLTPEHKTLVVALHEGAIAGSKIFDKDAKTHAHVHLASGNISWRSSAARKDVLDRGFVSVKCRVYHFKPRYTVSANINGTRYEAHVDRLGGHFMEVQHKNAQGDTVCSVLWFATKSASKTWQERGYAMIAPQQTDDRGATVNEQADAVLARFAPVAQEPAPAAPVTEEPVTEEPVTEEPVTEEPAPVAQEPVAQEPARPRPARHRNALAHLAGLNDVVRDFLVDTYATETEMRWHERDPHTWTEREARACLATQYLEELGYMPPRTCDTWEDVRELVREAYRLEALCA